MLNRLLDTFEGLAIFDLMVWHRSKPGISDHKIHQPRDFDGSGIRGWFSLAIADRISTISRGAYTTNVDQAVAIRNRDNFLRGGCDHPER